MASRSNNNHQSSNRWTADDAAKVATLDTKVTSLESQVHDVSERIYGLDTKLESSSAALANKIDLGLTNLSKQLADKGATKWQVVFTGCGVALTFAIALGGQALAPVWSNVSELKASLVPRTEVEFRYSVNDKRLTLLEDNVKQMQDQRAKDLSGRIDTLERENHDLRQQVNKLSIPAPAAVVVNK